MSFRRNLLSDLRQTLPSSEDVYYEQMLLGCSHKRALLSAWLGWIKFASLALRCFIRGDHDLVDEGHAGPDSGCIQMTCRCCGYSYPRHWLY